MNTETMIKELKAVAKKHKNDFVPTFQTNITAMCRNIILKLEQLVEYEAIGTVEECREARERQRVKKPNKADVQPYFRKHCANTYFCPICCKKITTNKQNLCQNCGQKLNWSEQVRKFGEEGLEE